MGWRFRKSFKFLPGFRLNIGKRGISGVTIGKRGFSASVGKQGLFQNIGIPGTGVSFRNKLGESSVLGALIGLGITGLILVGVISMCVVFASIGRNTRQQEVNTPAKFVSNSLPVSTPQPSTVTRKKRTKNNKAEKLSQYPILNKPSSRYTQGPRGGCYYINSSGNKTYVDRGLCQ